MFSEMRETLIARLLSCKLAMSIPDVPGPAVEKIRAIDNLASDLTTPGTELTVKSGRVWLDASLLTTPLRYCLVSLRYCVRLRAPLTFRCSFVL